ncbi:MAG: AI-2E family transporter [Haloarculaceae archaeon]
MVSFEFDIDWVRTGWVAFGLVLALVVLWILHSFVGTFIFALFLYYSTRRVNDMVLERVGQRTVSAALSLFVVALPAVLLLIYATAIGLQELQQFSRTTELGPYLEYVRPYLDVSEAFENPRAVFDRAGGFDLVRRTLSQTTDYVGIVGTALLHLFVMFSVAFYLLRDDHRLVSWAKDVAVEWGVVETYVVEVDASLERIFAGNILNALVTGTVGALVYSVLNLFGTDPVMVPYPALVGLLAGIASLIPVVGMKIVYVPVLGYLGVQAWMSGSGWGFVAAFGVVSFVIVDVIPDLVVRPYVSGGGLHTGALMFAYILGPLLFGWYGLFLGPVILVFVTHFVRDVVPELLPDGTATPSRSGPAFRPRSGPAGPASPTPPPSKAAPGAGSSGGDDGTDGRPVPGPDGSADDALEDP